MSSRALEDLLNDLANQDAQHDLLAMRQVREQIILEHPSSDEAAEAEYKIGLDLLFRERKLEEAAERFEQAAARKHPFWSASARTSLALCLYHQGRKQKALFELRKVGYAQEGSAHSTSALAFLETLLTREGQKEEALRARQERHKQLQALAAGTARTAERGYWLYMLATAQRDLGETEAAKRSLLDARDLGPDVLGAELYRAIVETLT